MDVMDMDSGMERRAAFPHEKIRADGHRRRTVLWMGPVNGMELGIARSGIEGCVDVITAASVKAALSAMVDEEGRRPPTFAILAADRPGRSTVADALSLTEAFPLMPIVSVTSSLVDGRRRSGPPLPGVEEVPWHDLPGRCRWWLAALDAGLPISLGLPATSRREERLLESLGGIGLATQPTAAVRDASSQNADDVAVAAAHADDLDGLCDLVGVAGLHVVSRRTGRPDMHESAGTLIWDVGDLADGELGWLRILAANRPRLFIVLLQSFPRGDAVSTALRSGAAAVLGRPVRLEALVGTLLDRSPREAGTAEACRAWLG